MTDQSSDERSGLERRDLLKGLGFGAVGGSLLAGRAAAQEQDCSGLIDFANLVPPGAEPDQSVKRAQDDTPDAGLDLVFQLDAPGMPKNGRRTIAYEMILVTKDEGKVVTSAFEKGRARAFAGTVQTTPGGETRRREEFSISGLGPDSFLKPPNDYWAVLIVSDLSTLTESGSCCVDCTTNLFRVRNPRQDPSTGKDEG